MFSLLQRFSPVEEPRAASVPRGVRVYAVGDIHGRIDLLDRMLADVIKDAEGAVDLHHYLVFLGDYVDRGLSSRQVLDRMIAPPPARFGAIHLRGNHEQAMLDFLDNEQENAAWLRFGGLETLFSYGVDPSAGEPASTNLAHTRDELARALPPAHLSFLRHTRLSVTIGDYFFVHAGVRPGVPLNEQSADDMLWIRNEFLGSRQDFGKVVVHGHTICEQPEIRANRIGIDTGAFASGRLTCLVLEGNNRRFLHT